jgi:conjugal transfer ATP-binding protein TraC
MTQGVLADQLQIWGFEGDFTLFTDGSVGFALDATPLDVSCRTDDAVNSLSDRLAQFLNGLPPGIDLQFVQEIEAGNKERLDGHRALAEASAGEIALELCRTRIERFEGLDQGGSLPRHGLKIFVRRPFQEPLMKRPRLLSRPSLFPKLSETRLKREIELTTRLRDGLVQNLKSLEMDPKPISSQSLAQILYAQWNPMRKVDLKDYDSEDIRSGLVLTDASVHEGGFSLSRMHYRLISLKNMPDRTFAAMAQHLRSLPFDSKLYLSIHVPHPEKELAALQTQRRVAYSMVFGKKSGVRDVEGHAKFQDLEELLDQMIAQGEKVFHVSMSILLRSTSEEALEGQVAETLMTFRELSGAEGMEEGLVAFDLFSELAMPNARSSERRKRMKTSNLADLLPVYGPWLGHEAPSILLRSRLGSLISFDPFSSRLQNANQIVSGGSGSGKSFMTNILLLQLLKENPKIFIVDIGGSYSKLCQNLGGQYIRLGADSGFALNPFDLPAGETEPSSTKIKFLLNLVEIMTKEEGDARLPKLERAGIEETIARVYSESGPRSISRLGELLLNHEDVNLRRFGRILSPWCGNSLYGKFIDRATTIELDRPVVCFDLKGLEDYPDLQAVCLFIITDFIWREVQRDRSTKKVLVLDECWRLLESGAEFIGEVYRTFRKYRASCIGISQNVDDFAKSKVANAILPNSSVKWILMQKGADQARLKEVLELNDNELAQVQSLRQERGVFSEAFLIAGDERAVVTIEAHPLEYWIATTDPADLSKIEEVTRSKPELPTLDLLQELARVYPQGVSAGAATSQELMPPGAQHSSMESL